jgi:tetratricopeptide (TPR) repeat protein
MFCPKNSVNKLPLLILGPLPLVILSGAGRLFVPRSLLRTRRPALSRNLSYLTFAVLFLTLCLIAPQSSIGQTSEDQLERFFRAGQQAMKQGDFARAAEEFKKVLALDPSLVEAEVNLGLAYQGLFNYDSAVRHLAKALRERPNLLGPTVIVGMDYLKLGSLEKAIPFLQRALNLDPSNREARLALASSYLGQ